MSPNWPSAIQQRTPRQRDRHLFRRQAGIPQLNRMGGEKRAGPGWSPNCTRSLWFRVSCLALLAIACVSVAGCGGAQPAASNPPSTQHDHDHASHEGEHEHAHSETFAETLTRVDELHANVKAGFTAGKPDEVDGPVHEIGHLLEALPHLADKESMAEADQQQVHQSVDRLMICFAALDERVHGGASAGKSYDEVAAQIDAALAELNSIGKEASP